MLVILKKWMLVVLLLLLVNYGGTKMKIEGSNIVTMNNSGLTKDVQIEHYDIKFEMITTKRGIAITFTGGKVILSGRQILLLHNNGDVYPCETEIKMRGDV
jgi:hypothetical protein